MASFNYTWEAPTFTWNSAEASKTWATALYYTHSVSPAESLGWSESLAKVSSVGISQSWDTGESLTPSLDYFVFPDETVGWSDAYKFTATLSISETSWNTSDGFAKTWSAQVALADGWGNSDNWALAFTTQRTDAWGQTDAYVMHPTVDSPQTVAFSEGWDRVVDFNTSWSESWLSSPVTSHEFTRPIDEASWGTGDAWDRTWSAVVSDSDGKVPASEIQFNDENYEPFWPLINQIDQQLDEGWDTDPVLIDAADQPREFSDSWGVTDAPAVLNINLGINESLDVAPDMEYINADSLYIEEETLWFNQTVSTWTNATGDWAGRDADWLNLFEVAPTSFEYFITLGALPNDGWDVSEASARQFTKASSEASVNFGDAFQYVNAFIQEIAESLNWAEALKFTLDGPHLLDGWGTADSIIPAMTWADPAPGESFDLSDAIGHLVDRGINESDTFGFSDSIVTLLENVSARGTISDVRVLTDPIDAVGFDDLMTYSSPPAYSDWGLFLAGDYTYQKAYVRIRLDPDEVGDSPLLTKTAVVADVPDINDGGNAAVTGAQFVPFNKTFHAIPEVVAVVTAGSSWAAPNLISVTTTGFTIELLTKQDNQTDGNINWQAEGY